MLEVREDLLDELLVSSGGPEALLGPDGLLKRLKAALVERALDTELTNHVGYRKHSPRGQNSGNSRDGRTAKTAIAD